MKHVLESGRVAGRSPAGRPLRIALFSGNYDCVRDGANRALNRLVAYLLDRAGMAVRIYSPTAPTKAFESVGDIVSVRSASIPGRPEYRLALGFTAAARADLEAFAPDIVHLSAPDILGRQAQKYARAAGIPVVASLHTRFETYPEYYHLGFLRRPMEAYLRRFYGDADHILLPTPPILDEFAALYGRDKMSIWSRGVDRTAFHPSLRSDAFRARLGYAPGDVVPLFFGRLVLEKGLGVLRRLPNVAFLGHLAGADLGCAVASADILVNPSVTEAFGNVNLEAMASGIGVVSADVPSASSLIVHGGTGLLVPPHDAAAYADAIAQLIDEPAQLAVLRRAAAVAADRYCWDDILAGVAALYGRLAGTATVAALARVA